LTPAIPSAPSISANGVVSTATSVAGTLAPNSWVTINGSNLGVTSRSWSDSDLVNGAIPFSLDGVSVVLTLFGAPRLAYVGAVRPTRASFLLPSDLVPTATTVAVRNPAGISASMPITVQADAPQLFTVDGKHVLGARTSGASLGSAAPFLSL